MDIASTTSETGPREPPRAVGADAEGTIVPAEYPELARLAWNRDPSRPIAGEEALALYERNWRHIDEEAMGPAERELVRALVDKHGRGQMLATR